MDILQDYISSKSLWIFVLNELKKEKSIDELLKDIVENYGIEINRIILKIQIKLLANKKLVRESNGKYMITKNAKTILKNTKNFLKLLGERL